jgi:hypothetical protein
VVTPDTFNDDDNVVVSLRLPAVFNGAIFTNTTCNTTCISSLNVSGVTTSNNATTCISSLNVSGVTIFSNWVGIGTTPTSVLESFNPFYATFKLKFGGNYAPNRIYSTGSFRFYTSFPYTSSDIIMVIGTITDYNNPSTGELVYLSLNTQGLTLPGYLNAGSITCVSTLNVYGNLTLNGGDLIINKDNPILHLVEEKKTRL